MSSHVLAPLISEANGRLESLMEAADLSAGNVLGMLSYAFAGVRCHPTRSQMLHVKFRCRRDFLAISYFTFSRPSLREVLKCSAHVRYLPVPLPIMLVAQI